MEFDDVISYNKDKTTWVIDSLKKKKKKKTWVTRPS